MQQLSQELDLDEKTVRSAVVLQRRHARQRDQAAEHTCRIVWRLVRVEYALWSGDGMDVELLIAIVEHVDEVAQSHQGVSTGSGQIGNGDEPDAVELFCQSQVLPSPERTFAQFRE